MRLLLDTHALIWWLEGAFDLSAAARAAITDPRSETHVSVGTVWEIGIKCAAGKLEVPPDLARQIGRHGFIVLPITLPHAEAAAALPRHHGDIFDRMLIAQARLENLTFVSRDKIIRKYDVELLRA